MPAAAGSQLLSRLASCVTHLSEEQTGALTDWLSQLPGDQFGARNVRPLQRHIGSLSRRQVGAHCISHDPRHPPPGYLCLHF
jgi:hypothetical protein